VNLSAGAPAKNALNSKPSLLLRASRSPRLIIWE
jgi:hypothetical protein